jgi:hypothetical protein
MYTTALLCFPKNLIPWRDTNPGLLFPEADAMSNASRRQAAVSVFFGFHDSAMNENLSQYYSTYIRFHSLHNVKWLFYFIQCSYFEGSCHFAIEILAFNGMTAHSQPWCLFA